MNVPEWPSYSFELNLFENLWQDLGVESPERLTAVTGAQSASTKYCLKGVNMYVHLIFLYLMFNKCANISKNIFSLCIVCRSVRHKIYLIHFEFRQ
jgi:hypothetical protein